MTEQRPRRRHLGWNDGHRVACGAVDQGACLGYATNDDGSPTVAFAVAGDTNLDGVVDLLDLANLMASGLDDSGAASGWQTGDFNDDGVVDLLDVVELLSTGLYDVGSYVLAAQGMPSTSRIE